jgi:hypothetical protein
MAMTLISSEQARMDARFSGEAGKMKKLAYSTVVFVGVLILMAFPAPPERMGSSYLNRPSVSPAHAHPFLPLFLNYPSATTMLLWPSRIR